MVKKNNKKRCDFYGNIKNFNLKEQYKKSWDFIKNSKKFIYLVLILFFVFVLVGFLVPAPLMIENKIIEFLKELLEKTKGMNCFEMIRFIFFNNIQSSFTGFIFGIVLGIFPLIATISNGYLLGFVGSMSVSELGITSLWKILPHGIFELPAIFISLGMGIRLGSFVFYKDAFNKFNYFFKNSLRVFVFIILPLLIIAGIIEGFLICSGM